MSVSAWGVDHGPEGIHKSADQPSRGRKLTGTLLPGWHGLSAGRKGRKLRAAGNQIVGTTGGGIAGYAANVATKGHLRLAPMVGASAGSYAGTMRAQRKGHFKAEQA